MNLKKSLSIFLAIGSLVALQSCSNTSSTIGSGETPEPSPPEATPAATPSPEATPQATPAATPSPKPTPEATPKATPSPKPTPAKTMADFDMERSAKLTDTAKLLAGMKLGEGSAIADLQNTNAWSQQNSFFENAWSQLESQQLSKVRTWSDAELPSINATSPQIFYPFSGPDFLYAYSLFPNAKEYVLVGLEPPGTLDDFEQLSASAVNGKLQGARESLYAILKFSFFRTKDMAVDLSQQGVLPVLLVFMARTNNKILDLQYVALDKDAQIQVLSQGIAAGKDAIPGVKISFVPEGKSNPRDLYYFSTDLSDAGLAKTPQFAKFIKTKDAPVTYLKAASYLMHYEEFTDIRNLILSQSSHVLQDDSGMPFRHFESSKWDMKFYGNYIGAIPLFAEFYQKDLRNIYAQGSGIKPINFGIGYKYYEGSHLMLMSAKDSTSASK